MVTQDSRTLAESMWARNVIIQQYQFTSWIDLHFTRKQKSRDIKTYSWIFTEKVSWMLILWIGFFSKIFELPGKDFSWIDGFFFVKIEKNYITMVRNIGKLENGPKCKNYAFLTLCVVFFFTTLKKSFNIPCICLTH